MDLFVSILSLYFYWTKVNKLSICKSSALSGDIDVAWSLVNKLRAVSAGLLCSAGIVSLVGAIEQEKQDIDPNHAFIAGAVIAGVGILSLAFSCMIKEETYLLADQDGPSCLETAGNCLRSFVSMSSSRFRLNSWSGDTSGIVMTMNQEDVTRINREAYSTNDGGGSVHSISSTQGSTDSINAGADFNNQWTTTHLPGTSDNNERRYDAVVADGVFDHFIFPLTRTGRSTTRTGRSTTRTVPSTNLNIGRQESLNQESLNNNVYEIS